MSRPHPVFLALLLGWELAASACASSSKAFTTEDGATRVPAQPGRPTPVGKQRLPTARERAAIARLMRLTERVRGLRFLRPVPIAIEDAEAVMDYARHELATEDFERVRSVYVALGMLEPDIDVEKLLISLLGEQVVGYYDARAGRLVVRDDVMTGLGTGGQSFESQAAREVLLHELVHALQDQHLDLSAQLELERTSDGENAFRALVEGDATLSVAAFAAQEGGISLAELIGDEARMRGLSTAIAAAAMASPLLSSAPAIIREPLLSAYRDGLSFAAQVYRRAGGFSGVNAAHASPPRTTEAILHPDQPRGAYSEVVVPDLTALTARGYQHRTTDTLGELELRVYLARGCSEHETTRAAAGWDGDQVRVWASPEGALAAVWLTHWDTVQDAREMVRAAARLTRQPCPPEAPGCGAPRITRDGRWVLLLHGVPPELAQDVVEAVVPAQLDQASRAH